jgi:hypothetical protein
MDPKEPTMEDLAKIARACEKQLNEMEREYVSRGMQISMLGGALMATVMANPGGKAGALDVLESSPYLKARIAGFEELMADLRKKVNSATN